MKFLLVGGDGYIGRVLQEEIEKSGNEFVVFDNNLLGLSKEREKIIHDDTLNKNGKLAKYTDYDVLVNLAAVVGDPACLVNPSFSIKNNCVGTRNMVEKANRDGKKIIHISTCSLYGSENCTIENPLTENSMVFPIDFYGQTKYQQERFVTDMAKDWVSLRLGTAYGQSERMRYDLVIPLFTAKAINEKKITVFGGNQWRPFVHIRDVARAIIFSAKKDLHGIYNIVEENLKIVDLANKLKKIIPETKIEINEMINDPRNYIVSNQKIKDDGFKFEWTIEDGIREMSNAKTIYEFDKVIYSNKELVRRRFEKI